MPPRARWFLGLVLCGSALFGAGSCETYEVPQKFCRGVEAQGAPAGEPALSCARCLDTRCCDAVGRCQEQGAACLTSVVEAHTCMLDAGAKRVEAEPGCVTGLEVPAAQEAYACMRGECGEACGLPHCTLDRAVPLIVNPRCDACFNGACCEEINRCFGDRACKLTLDCITVDCQGKLGAELRGPSPAALDALEALLCPDGKVAQGGAGAECVRACLGAFSSTQPPAAVGGEGAACLAFRVYACGVRAKCGEVCEPGSPVDAGGD